MAFSFDLSTQVDIGCTAIISPAISDSLYTNTTVIDVIFSLKKLWGFYKSQCSRYFVDANLC